jgi:predicted dinucleotide-binding enzyme
LLGAAVALASVPAPAQADPDKAAPAQADPDKAAPDKADPDKAAPDKADPDKADPARAGNKDAEARALNEEAIFTDYLTTEFSVAQEKLVKALELCSNDACSKPVIARLHRDLGVVLIAGLGDLENGRVELLSALQLDPTIELDKDLTTKEVQEAFEEAKAQVSGQPGEQAPQPATQPATPATGQEDQPAQETSEISDADLCPPDFPGCGDEGFENSFCDAASPCPEGYRCEDNACHEIEEIPDDAPQRKNWVSLAIQQDLLFLATTENLCAGEDYYCFFPDSEIYYSGTPAPDVSNRLASGGFRAATTRILVGFDRVLTSNISIGARAGFALGGAPAAPGGNAFVPLHAEARGTLWFGRGVFNKIGLRPFAFLGGGMAQVDAKVAPIWVHDQDQDSALELDAWRKTGLTFFALGAGAGYAINPALVPFVELKVMQMLGAAGTAAALQLGGTYGF